jgi:hypothetical protein
MMSLQESQSQDHIADLLPAYLNRTLDLQSTGRVQKHLLVCEACQQELFTWEALRDATRVATAAAPLPSANVLSQVWATIDAPVQRHATGWEFLKGLVLHYWLVFRRQIPIIHKSIWIATPLVLLFGCGLVLFATIQSPTSVHKIEIALALFTTVSSAAGVAFIYGAENDPALELTLSTPTSMRIVMFSRLLLVVGYNFMLSALASAIIALAHGGSVWEIMQLWLGPMLLLSSITLTLSLMIGSWLALLAALILEVTQGFLFGFERNIALLQLSQPDVWQTNPTMLFLAVLFIVFAVLYAPRQPRLPN